MVNSAATSTRYQTAYSSDRNQTPKPSLWPTEFMIENLPPWIYSDNELPKSVQDCEAKISALEFTIKDIELQIEIRELELRTGNSRHNSSFDFEKWKVQALRAKQTHFYLLNAYTYWMIKNSSAPIDTNEKLRMLIELLIEEPADFTLKAARLLK